MGTHLQPIDCMTLQLKTGIQRSSAASCQMMTTTKTAWFQCYFPFHLHKQQKMLTVATPQTFDLNLWAKPLSSQFCTDDQLMWVHQHLNGSANQCVTFSLWSLQNKSTAFCKKTPEQSPSTTTTPSIAHQREFKRNCKTSENWQMPLWFLCQLK